MFVWFSMRFSCLKVPGRCRLTLAVVLIETKGYKDSDVLNAKFYWQK